ncbi:MAG: hypothetical protein HQ557_05040 [Bacteroidetes bacterium]|nr:hypothetical protein [Bacteroidota bacterium]
MPQISLYIDEVTLKKVELAAKLAHLSISKFVAARLKEYILIRVYHKDKISINKHAPSPIPGT